MMEKPVLSPDFTVADIHKLREYHYETTKHLSAKERRDRTNQEGKAVYRMLMERKSTAPSHPDDESFVQRLF